MEVVNKDEVGAKVEESSQEKENKQGTLSYQDLLTLAQQLSANNQDLLRKLQETSMVNTFQRLNYLFKIIEHSSKKIFPAKFVKDAAKEIEELMSIEEENEDKE